MSVSGNKPQQHETLRRLMLGVASALACAMSALVVLGVTAGGTVSHAQPQATVAARAASTLVAICRASTTGATAVAQAAQQCQVGAATTPAPTRVGAGQQGAPTPTPPALVVFAAPSVKTSLVGAIIAPAGVPLRGVYPPIFGDRIALGMDGLRDTAVGSRNGDGRNGDGRNGDGIDNVTFTIVDQFDTVVHQVRTGRGDRFCAFGGNTPGCRAYDFAAHDWRWPSGQPVHSGRYWVFAFAQGDVAAHKGTWQAEFEVRLARDGQQAVDGAVKLLGVVVRSGRYVVVYETLGFTANWHGIRLRFYFDNLDPARLGTGVQETPPGPNQPANGVFSGLTVRERPVAAQQLCAIAVQPDGSVIPQTEDCQALP